MSVTAWSTSSGIRSRGRCGPAPGPARGPTRRLVHRRHRGCPPPLSPSEPSAVRASRKSPSRGDRLAGSGGGERVCAGWPRRERMRRAAVAESSTDWAEAKAYRGDEVGSLDPLQRMAEGSGHDGIPQGVIDVERGQHQTRDEFRHAAAQLPAGRSGRVVRPRGRPAETHGTRGTRSPFVKVRVSVMTTSRSPATDRPRAVHEAGHPCAGAGRTRADRPHSLRGRCARGRTARPPPLPRPAPGARPPGPARCRGSGPSA